MDNTIIIMLVGSFTTLLGVIMGHYLSGSRERRNIFNAAAEQFRNAFWPEIEFLDKKFLVDRASVNATRRSCDVLLDAVGSHQKAIFVFSDYLGCINKYRFKKAWNKYCKGGSNRHYFAEEYPCENEFQQSFSEDKALKRINEILKFANPK